MSERPLVDEYAGWLASPKSELQAARSRAALAVNQELIRLYHRIGTEILERQGREGWGARVIAWLSSDRRAEFLDMKKLSSTNLRYMKVFVEPCPAVSIGQQAADLLTWFHIGVAEYQLVCASPEPLDAKVPTIQQLEEELGAAMEQGIGDE